MRSLTKAINTATKQLQLPRSHKILNNNLQLYVYKVKLLQVIMAHNKPKRKEFKINILEQISKNETFFTQVCFSD